MSNSDLDGFESVSEQKAVWEPKQTGSKKTENLVALKADENSYIAGHYMGFEEGVGQKGNSTVHTIRVMKGASGKYMVGNPDTVSSEVTDSNTDVNIWGTGVLNSELAKAQPGELIKVTWKGKVQSKKDPELKYHTWDVAIKKGHAIDVFSAPTNAGDQLGGDDELNAEFNDSENHLEPASEPAPTGSLPDEEDDF